MKASAMEQWQRFTELGVHLTCAVEDLGGAWSSLREV